MQFGEGIYNIYKPPGITTYKVVKFVKKQLKEKMKVGHGGTLDPFAEGVVIVAVGRKYTKQLHYLLNSATKEYVAEILLDKTSDTYDVTGNVSEVKIENPPTKEEVIRTIKSFIGEIEQLPPPYSAKKVSGERLCDKIRFNKISLEEAKLLVKPKKVRIYNIELLEYDFPRLVLKIQCSSGTYIRSLAKDIGDKLNTGGIVSKLIRTKVDKYDIKNSIRINL